MKVIAWWNRIVFENHFIAQVLALVIDSTEGFTTWDRQKG